MADNSLTVSAVLQCPHGAAVTIVSANQRAKADHQAMATAADVFTIAGCTFAPGGVASPCVLVQWVSPNARVKVGSIAALSKSSVGLCLSAASAPQGPVSVVQTQAKVSSQ